MTTHTYTTELSWTGSTGDGYRRYSRDHVGSAPPAEVQIALSADAAFRGDGRRLNPEQLLVLAASSCQLLSFLAVAAQHGIEVLEYRDTASGVMDDSRAPARIDRVRLTPVVTVAAGVDHAEVLRLAHLAHEGCYIANSISSDVTLEVEVTER